jgi:hypothetical protein
MSAYDKKQPNISNNSLKQDGYSRDGEATATCYCGAVQLAFVSQHFELHYNKTEETTSLHIPPGNWFLPLGQLTDAPANHCSRSYRCLRLPLH